MFTCGLWFSVWLQLTAVGGVRQTTVNVDEYGRASYRKAPMEPHRIIAMVVSIVLGLLQILFIVGLIIAIIIAAMADESSSSMGTRTATTSTGRPETVTVTTEAPPPRAPTSEEPPPPPPTTTPPPKTPPAGPAFQVTYSVTGTKAPGDIITVTYVDASGRRRTQRNVYIPWSLTVTPISQSDVGSVQASSIFLDSRLNCSITTSDGTVLSSDQSNSAQASC